MEEHIKRMIQEHAELRNRIGRLHNYIYVDKGRDDNKVEFANKCVQLNAMRMYEKALRARLVNVGVLRGVDGVYRQGENEYKPFDFQSIADKHFNTAKDFENMMDKKEKESGCKCDKKNEIAFKKVEKLLNELQNGSDGDIDIIIIKK